LSRYATGNPLDAAPSSALFRDWKGWAEARGESPGTNKSLSETLVARGFGKKHTNKGAAFLGLKLKSSATGAW